jgi:uncharacterized membrane protein YgdD (TMEM256/DUF423 family)
MKNTIAILGALAVALGALGAHVLKDVLDPTSMASFKTAVLYHLFHTIALFALTRSSYKKLTARLWLSGILLFSGSIYLLSTDELMGLSFAFLGPITPLGGVLLIGGWLSLLGSSETNVDK